MKNYLMSHFWGRFQKLLLIVIVLVGKEGTAAEACGYGARPIAVILLGAPGSGKGVQSRRLSDEYKVSCIDVGNLLRQIVMEDGTLGRTIRSYLERGELVPNSVVLDIIFNRIDQPDCTKGFIIDGSSRTRSLADSICQHIEQHFDYVAILIDVPESALWSRLMGRRICRSCGSSYQLIEAPPRSEGVCDRCGGVLIRRSDDQIEIIQARMERYKQEAQQVRSFYLEKNRLKIVNGAAKPEAVTQEIVQQLAGL